MNNPEIDISVIIPVYNGEKYLSQTLDSLLRQTFNRFEVICVDDCSTDSSLSILKSYQRKDSRIRCITTESNLGIVPKVINYALPSTRGMFYAYASQDDLFSEDWLEEMFNRIQYTKADAVIPDLVFYHESNNAKDTYLVGVRGNRDLILSNREAVTLSLDWTISGNALWNANLIKKIKYEEFGMNADEYSARVFFFNCNKIVFSKGTFYYRQDNPEAITKKLSYKTFDIPYTTFRLYKFLQANQFDQDICAKIFKQTIMELIDLNKLLLKQKFKYFFLRKVILSRDAQKEAQTRMKRLYKSLHKCDIINFVLKQQSVKCKIIGLAIICGYTIFNILSAFWVLFDSFSNKISNIMTRSSYGRKKV
jgi:glycosyltransferase involved in cell wall biosynthesis